MNKCKFRNLLDYMVSTYGVHAVDDGEDLFFECPECYEPILFEDWRHDAELASGCCPICGERIVD